MRLYTHTPLSVTNCTYCAFIKLQREKPQQHNILTADLLTEGGSSAATEEADGEEHGCRTKSCLSKSFNASVPQAHTTA